MTVGNRKYPNGDDYDDIFAEHIKEKREEHDRKMSIPVGVKSKDPGDLKEREKREMELVYKDLAPFYCLCNHKMIRHDEDTGKCRNQTTRVFNGKLTTFECECKQFVSIKDQAEQDF